MFVSVWLVSLLMMDAGESADHVPLMSVKSRREHGAPQPPHALQKMLRHRLRSRVMLLAGQPPFPMRPFELLGMRLTSISRSWPHDNFAPVHTVAGSAFMVSPRVFQRFAQEHPEAARLARPSDVADWAFIQKQNSARAPGTVVS